MPVRGGSVLPAGGGAAEPGGAATGAPAGAGDGAGAPGAEYSVGAAGLAIAALASCGALNPLPSWNAYPFTFFRTSCLAAFVGSCAREAGAPGGPVGGPPVGGPPIGGVPVGGPPIGAPLIGGPPIGGSPAGAPIGGPDGGAVFAAAARSAREGTIL